MYKCPICGHEGKIVNECRCDRDNLPTCPRWRVDPCPEEDCYLIRYLDTTLPGSTEVIARVYYEQLANYIVELHNKKCQEEDDAERHL